MASLEIGRLREDLEPFESELMEEFYSNFAGLKDEMSTVSIYEKYAHLFSKEATSTIASALENESNPEDNRWLRYFNAFSVLGFVDNSIKVLSDRATTFGAQAVIDCDGEKIPYRFAPIRQRNEPDRPKRKTLFEATQVETEKLNATLFERMAMIHDISTALGYKSYRDMCSTLKGVDYKALEEKMESVLRKTEQLYISSMDVLLKERAGTSLAEAWKYDIPYAFRGEEFDKDFDKDKLVDSFFKTLQNMGIDPEKYPNVKVDTETRPKKSPRAFCAPVRVPEDVRLVIMPSGGWRDYEAFFHEGGHAWHFGTTGRELPAEYRYLGDNSVTESFAFLFNYLTSNKLWLSGVMGVENPDKFVRFVLVNKLMFLRRYAAKLIYELKLHTGKLNQEFAEVYRSTLQKSLKFRHSEKDYLEDVDDSFYCAEYLRAWILEAQLRAALEEGYGEEWFKNPKAGSYLKELWSYGQKFNADELVKTIGYADLDESPLVSEIERGLAD
ncbi:MAG TPA: hypothetical protein VGB78_00970 [Thermoplasmata archaeon]